MSKNSKATQYKVVTNSAVYGREEYKYDTLVAAYKGIARLARNAASFNDGVLRSYKVGKA